MHACGQAGAHLLLVGMTCTQAGVQACMRAPADPHVGKGGEGGQDGAADPDQELALRGGQHTDLGVRGCGGGGWGGALALSG